MANIRSRGNKLLIDFYYQGIRCREQTALVDNRVNRARLKKILDDIQLKIRLKRFVFSEQFPDSNRCDFFIEHDKNATYRIRNESFDPTPKVLINCPNFDFFSMEWLLENKIHWKQSHFKNVKMIIESYLIPQFGNYEISDISREMIMKFRAGIVSPKRKLASELSNDWINHIMTPLRMILAEASVRFDFTSPFIGIKPLKLTRTKIEPFSLNEVNLFLDNVRSDFINYYTVRFFTGMRTAEIDGLQWEFVDLDKGEVIIEKTVVDGRIETPKNKSSYRTISLPAPVLIALKSQKQVTDQHKFVFCNSQGNPLDHRNITKRVWYPTLSLLKLKKRRPYQTRHTCASLWLASGENPEWIAMQLGHSTTKMLFEVYSRYIPNLTRQDGSAFERMLANAKNSPLKE